MIKNWLGLVLSWGLLLSLGSCGNINPFDNYVPDDSPDTIVGISNNEKTVYKILIRYSDTFEIKTHYRTDPLTGRILYKMIETPYRNHRIHGQLYKFNSKGDTTYFCDYNDGIKSNIEVYRYDNNQIKQKYFYSRKRTGNRLFELNFHSNGQRLTDTIQYYEGMLNGAINYYDATPKNALSERYFYVDNKLIGVKIFNKKYTLLERRTREMREQMRRDSMEMALAKTDSSLLRNQPLIIESAKRANDQFFESDEWNMLKEDPNFILFEDLR